MRYLEENLKNLPFYQSKHPILNSLRDTSNLSIEEISTKIREILDLSKQKGLPVLSSFGLPRLYHRIDQIYKDLNLKSLESQPDLAYEKISKLLKLDFLLNGVHEKVENQTLNLDVFFDVFIFWLDYPVQSILIDGISDIIEHNKYTTSNNEILVALGNTCYNLLKYSFPAMLSEIDSCENVLNWVNDQIYSNLSVLPGFDRFQILREKLNESETLNTVRKFLAALNERKINRKYIVDVAFKVSYSIHLSNFIEGKDKNLLSILCGMLKFLRRATSLKLVKTKLGTESYINYLKRILMIEETQEWTPGLIPCLNSFLPNLKGRNEFYPEDIDYQELLFSSNEGEISLGEIILFKMSSCITKTTNDDLSLFWTRLSENVKLIPVVEEKYLQNYGKFINQVTEIIENEEESEIQGRATDYKIFKFYLGTIKSDDFEFASRLLSKLGDKSEEYLESGVTDIVDDLAIKWADWNPFPLLEYNPSNYCNYSYSKSFLFFLSNPQNFKPSTLAFFFKMYFFYKSIDAKNSPQDREEEIKYVKEVKTELREVYRKYFENFIDLQSHFNLTNWIDLKNLAEPTYSAIFDLTIDSYEKLESYYKRLLTFEAEDAKNSDLIPSEIIDILRGPVMVAAYVIKNFVPLKSKSVEYGKIISQFLMKIYHHPVIALIPSSIYSKTVFSPWEGDFIFLGNQDRINMILHIFFKRFSNANIKNDDVFVREEDLLEIRDENSRLNSVALKPVRKISAETFDLCCAFNFFSQASQYLKKNKVYFPHFTVQMYILPEIIKYVLNLACIFFADFNMKDERALAEFHLKFKFLKRFLKEVFLFLKEYSQLNKRTKDPNPCFLPNYFQILLEILVELFKKYSKSNIYLKTALLSLSFYELKSMPDYNFATSLDMFASRLAQDLEPIFIECANELSLMPESHKSFKYLKNSHENIINIYDWLLNNKEPIMEYMIKYLEKVNVTWLNYFVIKSEDITVSPATLVGHLFTEMKGKQDGDLEEESCSLLTSMSLETKEQMANLRKDIIKNTRWTLLDVEDYYAYTFLSEFRLEYIKRIDQSLGECLNLAYTLNDLYPETISFSLYPKICDLRSFSDKSKIPYSHLLDDPYSERSMIEITRMYFTLHANLNLVTAKDKVRMVSPENIELLGRKMIDYYTAAKRANPITEANYNTWGNYIYVLAKLTFTFFYKYLSKSLISPQVSIVIDIIEIISDFIKHTKDYKGQNDRLSSLLAEYIGLLPIDNNQVITQIINMIADLIKLLNQNVVLKLIDSLIILSNKAIRADLIPDFLYIELQIKEIFQKVDHQDGLKMINKDLFSDLLCDDQNYFMQTLEKIGTLKVYKGLELYLELFEKDPKKLGCSNSDFFTTLKHFISKSAKQRIMMLIELATSNTVKNANKAFSSVKEDESSSGLELAKGICILLKNQKYLIPYAFFTPLSESFLENLEVPHSGIYRQISTLIKEKKPITFLEVILLLMVPVYGYKMLEIVLNICESSFSKGISGEVNSKIIELDQIILDKLLAMIYELYQTFDYSEKITPQCRDFWFTLVSLIGNIKQMLRDKDSAISFLFDFIKRLPQSAFTSTSNFGFLTDEIIEHIKDSKTNFDATQFKLALDIWKERMIEHPIGSSAKNFGLEKIEFDSLVGFSNFAMDSVVASDKIKLPNKTLNPYKKEFPNLDINEKVNTMRKKIIESHENIYVPALNFDQESYINKFKEEDEVGTEEPDIIDTKVTIGQIDSKEKWNKMIIAITKIIAKRPENEKPERKQLLRIGLVEQVEQSQGSLQVPAPDPLANTIVLQNEETPPVISQNELIYPEEAKEGEETKENETVPSIDPLPSNRKIKRIEFVLQKKRNLAPITPRGTIVRPARPLIPKIEPTKSVKKTSKYFTLEFISNSSEFKSFFDRYSRHTKQTMEALLTAKILMGKERTTEISRDLFLQVFKDKPLFERSSIALSLRKCSSITPDENLKSYFEEVQAEYEDIMKDWDNYKHAKMMKLSRDYQPKLDMYYVEGIDGLIEIVKDSESDREARLNPYELENRTFQFHLSAKINDGYLDHQWIRRTFAPEEDDMQKKISQSNILDESQLRAVYDGYIFPEDQIILILEFLVSPEIGIDVSPLFNHPVNEVRFVDMLLLLAHNPDLYSTDSNGPFGNYCKKYNSTKEEIFIKIMRYIKISWELLMNLDASYLEIFNSKKIKDLKLSIDYAKKLENCRTVYDVFLKLLDQKDLDLSSVALVVFTEFWTEFQSKKDFNNPVSSTYFFGIIDDFPENNDMSRMENMFQEVSRHSNDYFVTHYSYVTKFLLPKLVSISKEAVKLINTLRDPEIQTNIDPKELLLGLSLKDLKILELTLGNILRNYTTIFFEPMILPINNSVKISEIAFLRTVEFMKNQFEDMFKTEIFEKILVIYNLLDQIAKKGLQENNDPKIKSLISIGVLFGSNLLIKEKIEQELNQNSAVNTDIEQEIPLPDLVKSFSTLEHENKLNLISVFTNFAAKYQKVLTKNLTSFRNPEYFVLITRFPWLFTFENKIEFLITRLREANLFSDSRTMIEVNRESIVYSMAHQLSLISEDQLRRNIQVKFENEPGIDQGGLRAELYTIVSKYIFDPEFGLFKLTPNQNSIEINPYSVMVLNYLNLFEFAGVILAKAILEKFPLNVTLTRSILKTLLGQQLTINDLEDIDQDLTKSLYYLLENNAEEISTNYIYTYQDFNGSPITCELVPGGFNIDITDENKHQYIKDFCEKRMFKDVKPQLDAFCRGFRSILPLRMINIFCPQDLQLMISGVGKIDVTEMLSHLTLEDSNSYDNSEQFIWLTEILSEYSQEKLSLFLQFITGLTKVPLSGFKANPIKIRFTGGSLNSLPVAHTCSRTLDLPRYQDKDRMREKFNLAFYSIEQGFHIQ